MPIFAIGGSGRGAEACAPVHLRLRVVVGLRVDVRDVEEAAVALRNGERKEGVRRRFLTHRLIALHGKHSVCVRQPYAISKQL